MTEKDERLAEIEALMTAPEFWADKTKAQALVREYQTLKEGGGEESHDAGDATLAILAGAGGDDAEDFTRMLLNMYRGYAARKGWGVKTLDETTSEHGGYRSVLVEIVAPSTSLGVNGPYGRLKHEAGVHRLVRQSPFNAQAKRQTSFSLVEVLPRLAPAERAALKPDELDIQFAKSGGAGGQNVNKRETAVRILHKPTNLSVHISSERSQAANKEKALELLAAKFFAQQEEEQKAEKEGRSVAKHTKNEWGSQIRSYVLHPYKMVKDHRTNVESSNPDKVLAGDLDPFINAAERYTGEDGNANR